MCLHIVASLSAAVHEILLPIMKEIKNDLNSVKNELSSLNRTVISLNDSMNRISDNVEAHDNHVTNELMELRSKPATELHITTEK